ncbi:MAG: YbjN domain-containing protein [Bacteroidota bacterium]
MMNELALRQALEKICSDLGWQVHIQPMDSYTLVICPLPNDAHFSGVLFAMSSTAQRLIMYVAYRAKASQKRWEAMSELITRINFGLLGGCFEMDSEQGEVRYRDGLLLITPKVEIKLLKALVATTLRDAMTYHPVIESVAAGHSPTQAIADVEKHKV